MGKSFDGSYAEYCLVPIQNILKFESDLSWDILGAITEIFQTVSGSLQQVLEVKEGETLLIRAGSSSIGMLATQLAKSLGVKVISTTRNENKKQHLLDNGAYEVLIDNGKIYKELIKRHPNGLNKALELIGNKTLRDSLKCIALKGTVCMTGILRDE